MDGGSDLTSPCMAGLISPAPPNPLLCVFILPTAAYDFQEDKQEEEGDADLAKIEQLKQLMGGCRVLEWGGSVAGVGCRDAVALKEGVGGWGRVAAGHGCTHTAVPFLVVRGRRPGL